MYGKKRPKRATHPFWTDMSEMGIARRAKFHKDLNQLVDSLLKDQPKPADIDSNITVFDPEDADK